MRTRAESQPAGARAPDFPVTVTNQTDAELVEACLAGHSDAFATIVERHRRQVYQLCYRFGGSHEEASDLAQEVFIRAYKGLRTFKGQSSFGTWLYRVGVNVCLNKVGAKNAVTVPLPEGGDVIRSHEEPADAAVLREERTVQVRAAI